MAVDVKPVLVIAGEVQEVADRSYTDRSTGEVTDKGRRAVIKTARGFVQMNIPVRSASLSIAAGDVGAWYVTPFEWGQLSERSEGGVRYGVAYVFEEALSTQVAAALTGQVPAAA